MFTKTALIAAMILGTASAAFATGEYDPNPANRYPAFAAPGAQFQSAPVALQSRNVSLNAGQTVTSMDRAGGSVDGGTSR